MSPEKIGTDGANTFPSTIETVVVASGSEDRQLQVIQRGGFGFSASGPSTIKTICSPA